MSATALVGVAVAGALGASARYLVDRLVRQRTRGPFPWGTLLVNVSGSFVLGLVTGAALYHGFGGDPKVWLATGFCGAYTTMSTFAFETVRLIEEGDTGPALVNLAVSLALGFGAAAVGLALVSVR